MYVVFILVGPTSRYLPTTLGNMLLMYKDFLSVVNIDLTNHILLLFIPPNMSKQTIKDFEEILKLRQASKVRFFRRVCKKEAG